MFQTLGEDDHPVLNPTHGIVMLADDGTFYNDDTDRLMAVEHSSLNEYAVYDLSGRKISSSPSIPHSSLKRKGVHIIRMSNGTTRKIVKK